MILHKEDEMRREDTTVIDKVRDVLINDWDPLEIRENSNLRDEYDAYIGRILSAISSNATVTEITEILARIEEDDMGLVPDRKSLIDVSLKLLSLEK